jgi:hypothetical protein
MARFSLASRASFQSEHMRVSARISISVTVRSLGRAWGGRDDRLVAELSEYSGHAELLDIAATLDRYTDEETAQLRDILAGPVRRPVRAIGGIG